MAVKAGIRSPAKQLVGCSVGLALLMLSVDGLAILMVKSGAQPLAAARGSYCLVRKATIILIYSSVHSKYPSWMSITAGLSVRSLHGAPMTEAGLGVRACLRSKLRLYFFSCP